MDTTFDVCKGFYATFVTFKQRFLERDERDSNRGRKSEPHLYAAVLLHTHQTVATFHWFFSTLKLELIKHKANGDLCFAASPYQDPSIAWGSDQEGAIVAALAIVFPCSPHFYCQIHLLKNLQRFLNTKAAINNENIKSKKSRWKFCELIFSQVDGLVVAMDEADADEIMDEVREVSQDWAVSDQRYMDRYA